MQLSEREIQMGFPSHAICDDIYNNVLDVFQKTEESQITYYFKKISISYHI